GNSALQAWDLDTNTKDASFQANGTYVYLMAISNDSARIALVDSVGGIKLLDAGTGATIASKVGSSHDSPSEAQFSPDDSRLVIEFASGKAAIVNLAPAEFEGDLWAPPAYHASYS